MDMRVILEIGLLIAIVFLYTLTIMAFQMIGIIIGHWIAYRDSEWSFTIGWGKNIIKSEKFAIRILPIWSDFFSETSKEKKTWKKELLQNLCGSFFSLLMIVALILIKSYFVEGTRIIAENTFSWLIGYGAVVNILMIVKEVVPIKLRVSDREEVYSDGYEWYYLWKTKD